MTNNKNLTEIQEHTSKVLSEAIEISRLEVALNMVPEIARLSGLDELAGANNTLKFLEDEEAISKRKEELKKFISAIEKNNEEHKPIERISFLIDEIVKGIDSLKKEYNITLSTGMQSSLDNRLEDFSKNPLDKISRDNLLTAIADIVSNLHKQAINILNPKKEETNVE